MEMLNYDRQIEKMNPEVNVKYPEFVEELK